MCIVYTADNSLVTNNLSMYAPDENVHNTKCLGNVSLAQRLSRKIKIMSLSVAKIAFATTINRALVHLQCCQRHCQWEFCTVLWSPSHMHTCRLSLWVVSRVFAFKPSKIKSMYHHTPIAEGRLDGIVTSGFALSCYQLATCTSVEWGGFGRRAIRLPSKSATLTRHNMKLYQIDFAWISSKFR